MLGPEWKIFVLTDIKNTKYYFRNFIEESYLPEGFDNIELWQTKSDHIRLSLLKKYGGV